MSTTLTETGASKGRNVHRGIRSRSVAMLTVALTLLLGSAGPGLHPVGTLVARSEQTPPPALTATVNDFANVVSPADKAELDRGSKSVTTSRSSSPTDSRARPFVT